MNTYPVTVSRSAAHLLIELNSLDNVTTRADCLGDVVGEAREFVAATTGEPMTDIALAITWAIAPPNRLRSVHSQLKLRHYSVGSIEVVNGVWTFPIEAGPGPVGAGPAGVWITDVGEDEPERDQWAPQHVRWATSHTNYTGEGTFSPHELADKILQTVATDDAGGGSGG
jgi:hypothetical protein